MSGTPSIESLFREHYPQLCEYALTLVGSTAAAEDIVQDTFLRLWERRDEWTPTTSVEAYLYRSVRNRALNHLKEHRHSHREQVDLARMAQSMHRNSEQTLEQHQLAKAIDQGMKEMSDRQHEVFTLSRFHDLAYAEIAEVLDVSTKTVGTHMTRALQTLREELELHRR